MFNGFLHVQWISLYSMGSSLCDKFFYVQWIFFMFNGFLWYSMDSLISIIFLHVQRIFLAHRTIHIKVCTYSPFQIGKSPSIHYLLNRSFYQIDIFFKNYPFSMLFCIIIYIKLTWYIFRLERVSIFGYVSNLFSIRWNFTNVSWYSSWKNIRLNFHSKDETPYFDTKYRERTRYSSWRNIRWNFHSKDETPYLDTSYRADIQLK